MNLFKNPKQELFFVITIFIASSAALHTIALLDQSTNGTDVGYKDAVNSQIGIAHGQNASWQIIQTRLFVPYITLGLNAIGIHPKIIIVLIEFISSLFVTLSIVLLCKMYKKSEQSTIISLLMITLFIIITNITIPKIGELFKVGFFLFGVYLIRNFIDRGSLKNILYFIFFSIIVTSARFDVNLLLIFILALYAISKRSFAWLAGSIAAFGLSAIEFSYITYFYNASDTFYQTFFLRGGPGDPLRIMQIFLPNSYLYLLLIFNAFIIIKYTYKFYKIKSSIELYATLLFSIVILFGANISEPRQFVLIVSLLILHILPRSNSYTVEQKDNVGCFSSNR